MSSKEIEFVGKNYPTKTSSADNFSDKFYQMFDKEIILILHNFFPEHRKGAKTF